jgi:hypothetical protein
MGNLWSNGNAKRTFNIGFAAPKIWFKTWVKLIMQCQLVTQNQLNTIAQIYERIHFKFMSEFTKKI